MHLVGKVKFLTFAGQEIMGLRSSQFNTAPRGETFEYLEGECNIALTVIKYVVLKKKK